MTYGQERGGGRFRNVTDTEVIKLYKNYGGRAIRLFEIFEKFQIEKKCNDKLWGYVKEAHLYSEIVNLPVFNAASNEER